MKLSNNPSQQGGFFLYKPASNQIIRLGLMRMPSEETIMPSAEMRMPSAEMKMPSVEMRMPSAEMRIPSARMKITSAKMIMLSENTKTVHQ